MVFLFGAGVPEASLAAFGVVEAFHGDECLQQVNIVGPLAAVLRKEVLLVMYTKFTCRLLAA